MFSNRIITYLNEIYIRSTFLITLVLILLVILLNFIEFLNNFYFFFSELQINDLEYFYYNNIYYNNNIITYLNYEYDWYLDYNIYFLKFGNQNIAIQLYIKGIIYILMPYILYEMYLFISSALYNHEKFKFKFWIFFTLTNNILYFYTIEKNVLNNYFFYWNEDTFIYLDNEIIDIFININELSKINLISICINFLITQFFYFQKSIYNITIIYIIRYWISSLLVILLLSFIVNISFVITYLLAINWIFYVEATLIMYYCSIYYNLLKY